MQIQRQAPDSGLRSEWSRRAFDARPKGWLFDPWAALRGGVDTHASVLEKDDGLIARFELPGVDPERIDVRVVGRELTLTVTREDGDSDEPETAHRFGTFKQTVALPFDADPEQTYAKTRHGVLFVGLKKPVEHQTRRIPVKAV